MNTNEAEAVRKKKKARMEVPERADEPEADEMEEEEVQPTQPRLPASGSKPDTNEDAFDAPLESDDEEADEEEDEDGYESDVKTVKKEKKKKKGDKTLNKNVGRTRPPTPKEVALKLDPHVSPKVVQKLKVHLLMEMRYRGTSDRDGAPKKNRWGVLIHTDS